MFTTNSFTCYRHLASRSRAMNIELKIPRLITYVFTHAQCSNRGRSRVPNFQGWGRGPGGQNRDIHLTFLGPRLQRGYRRYVTITKPRSTSLHSAINFLGEISLRWDILAEHRTKSYWLTSNGLCNHDIGFTIWNAYHRWQVFIPVAIYPVGRVKILHVDELDPLLNNYLHTIYT